MTADHAFFVVGLDQVRGDRGAHSSWVDGVKSRSVADSQQPTALFSLLLSHANQIEAAEPDAPQPKDAQPSAFYLMDQFLLTKPTGNAPATTPTDGPPIGGIDGLLEEEAAAVSQHPCDFAYVPSPIVREMQCAETDHGVVRAVPDRQSTHLPEDNRRTPAHALCGQGDHDRVDVDGIYCPRVHQAEKQLDANATSTSDFQNFAVGERTAELEKRRRDGASLRAGAPSAVEQPSSQRPHLVNGQREVPVGGQRRSPPRLARRVGRCGPA